MKHLKRLKINSDYLLKYFASHLIGLPGFTQVVRPTVRVVWIPLKLVFKLLLAESRYQPIKCYCSTLSNANYPKFRWPTQSARLPILQYILTVIFLVWYTFSGFDISNESIVFTAAKLQKIFKITPQMYQVRVVTLLSEPTKVEWNVHYVSYCVSYKNSPCIRPYFK